MNSDTLNDLDEKIAKKDAHITILKSLAVSTTTKKQIEDAEECRARLVEMRNIHLKLN